MVDRWLEPKQAVVVVGALLVAAAAFGAAADRTPAGAGSELPQAMGSSGAVFAGALGGVRTAAAAYLWIKLDDAHHGFYDGDMRKEQPLMPLFRIATWLDPHLEKAYYVGSYMLWLYKRKAEAIGFAQEGLDNNPTSVLLTLNLGQLYLFEQGNAAKSNALMYLTRAEKLSRGRGSSVRFQVLGSLDGVYKKWKIPGEPPALVKELARLRAYARKQARERSLPGGSTGD